jgi:hypothetical protein
VYTRESGVVTTRRLQTGGRLRRVDRRRKVWPARATNPVNPRVGSVLQYTRGSLEEETVEVVRNHEGGTWSGGGSPFPMETTTWSPGVDSNERCLDGRAIFEGIEAWCGVVSGNGDQRRGGKPRSTNGCGCSPSGWTRP